MTPILYASNETNFTSNGIGRLADARRCEVTEERNGQYELLLEYPTNGALLSYIVAGNYIMATHDSSGKPQPFQIYNVSEPLNGFIEVRAWHISYALNAIILKPFTASSCAEAVSLLASKSINTNPFSFWTDKSVSSAFALTVPKSVRAVLGGSEGSLLDVYGKGEYEFDLYDVKLHLNRGVDRGVQIRYGKNLVSLERELDASNIHNAVVPYWTDGETTVTLDHLVVKTGQTAGRAVALDLSDSWDAAPTTAELEAKAQNIIDASESYELKENLKLDFVFLWQTEEYKDIANLERVNLCDTVHIIYTKRGINATAKVIKVVYDALRERYLEMELGEPRTSLYQQIQQDTVQTVTPMIPSRPAIQSAIEKATELISGGFGGYIKYKYLVDGTPSEMLIMDAPSEATATNIIRLNQNGIGFSTDGGATYRNAWTIDGQLNADFITTGNLIASIITTGLLQDALGRNYWNLDTGQFVTTYGQIGNFTLENGVLKYGTDNDDNEPYVEISTNRLVYKPANWNARMVIDGQKLTFESYDDTTQTWTQQKNILSGYYPDPADSSKEYPGLMLQVYDPDTQGYVVPCQSSSGNVFAGEAPAGETNYYSRSVMSTFVNGVLGAVSAVLYNPLGIESGGTGGVTDYNYRTTSTSTSAETTKSYTVRGSGLVYVSATCYTDNRSSYGSTQSVIEHNGTIIAMDSNRFGTAIAYNFGSSCSAFIKVSDGDTILTRQMSSKNGTKTIMMYCLAFGCTLS